MTREEYQEYLTSLHWQQERKAALARAKYRCQVCGERDVQLEVHHNTYAHLGEERPEDLFVLCEDCHGLFSEYGKLAPAPTEGEEAEEFYEDEDTRGKLQIIMDGCGTAIISHPRFTLGGGTLLSSLAIDLFTKFNPMAVTIGLSATVIFGWKGNDLVEGVMQMLAPGSDQKQTQAVAVAIADHVTSGTPEYRDQSVLGKLARIAGRGDHSVAEESPEERRPSAKSLPAPLPKRAVIKQDSSQREEKVVLSIDLASAWFNEGRIDATQYFALIERIDGTPSVSPVGEGGETVKWPLERGEGGESTVKLNEVSPPLSPTVSPEDEALIVRTAFTLQTQTGKVTREDIKAALGWNNKRHGEIKVVCDKYGIAVPPGGGK